MNNDRFTYHLSRYMNLSWNLLKCRFATHTPVFLTHVATDFCNQRCQFCNVWVQQLEKDIQKELRTGEVFDMLDKAHDAGMVSYTIWGGEPLLRPDMEEILAYAHKKKFLISMITNGYLLEKKAEMVGAYVDYLIVSIDAVGDLHDELRGRKESFERAHRGIQKLKGKTRIILNDVICNRNVNEVDKVIEYARSMGASLTFEPVQRIHGFNDHLTLTPDQQSEVFAQIYQQKVRGNSIANSKYYFKAMTQPSPFTCHAPKMYITVNADGTIYSCKGKTWGNIREQTFLAALRSKEYTKFARESEPCNECVVSCVIETSKAYDLHPAYYYDMTKSFFR